MNCNTCGFQLPKEAVHCPRCGSAVEGNDANDASTVSDATVTSASPYVVSQTPAYNNFQSPSYPPASLPPSTS